MTIEQLAGWSAIVAAVATVVGAVFLGLFFSRGQPWGTWNDVASIVLMLATIPVALVIGTILSENESTIAVAVTAVGIVGMVGAALAQVLLVARIRTYEQLLPWTLGFGAVVGLWYLKAAYLSAATSSLGQPLPILMFLAGIGFIAIGYGFYRGGQKDPIAAIGGVVLVVASPIFLTWLGLDLVAGRLVVPSWNA
ncbi:MAG: hypothetical protein EPO36_09140 [Chloroflexota bacterium]|nr:MAG: hypothetical protein EPO36_09140 [Chloroflexota bacterium]